jgi:hypothetical protein
LPADIEIFLDFFDAPDIYCFELLWSFMHLKRIMLICAAVAAVEFSATNLFCQSMYAYVDENGVQHYTNIPPVNNISNFKVTGSERPAAAKEEPKPKTEQFNPIIEKYAQDYQLPPSLIHSIIAAESDFNPKAVSPKGARGLMQLMPATAARLGVNNSFDPEQNIRGGVQHFRWLMNNFNNDLSLSLAAYNAGENLVQRLGRVPEIKETREYVQKVKSKYDKKILTVESQAKSQIYKIFQFVDDTGVLHLTNIPPIH